jgi:hypothetical protein
VRNTVRTNAVFLVSEILEASYALKQIRLENAHRDFGRDIKQIPFEFEGGHRSIFILWLFLRAQELQLAAFEEIHSIWAKRVEEMLEVVVSWIHGQAEVEHHCVLKLTPLLYLRILFEDSVPQVTQGSEFRDALFETLDAVQTGHWERILEDRRFPFFVLDMGVDILDVMAQNWRDGQECCLKNLVIRGN